MMHLRERGIVSAVPVPPIWYCLFVQPGKEMATREHLRANGVYAFYPSREKRYTARGRVYRRELPEVTGYVFAQFRQEPQWDVLKERRRLITGVLGGSHPYPIHRDVIRHLQGLTVEAQRLEEARREMMRIREGDRAKITEGPFRDFIVDVRSVNGDDAEIDAIAFGRVNRVKIALSSLERVLGLV